MNLGKSVTPARGYIYNGRICCFAIMPVLFRSEWTKWYLTSVAVYPTRRGTHKRQLAIQVQEILQRGLSKLSREIKVSQSPKIP